MQIAVEVQEEMILELRAAKEASIKGVAMEEKMRQNFIQAQQELQEVKEETEALTKALQLTKEENIKLQTEIGQLNSYYKEVSRQLEESKRLREQEEIMQDRLLKKLQALEQENAMLRKGSK
ncbi:MAG: hypothetical protein FJZ58_08500 [Chlamydiae bacterium]|nr:hypothetical protein [Chlamydiota bacterium]